MCSGVTASVSHREKCGVAVEYDLLVGLPDTVGMPAVLSVSSLSLNSSLLSATVQQSDTGNASLTGFCFDVCIVLAGRCGQSISMVTEFDVKLVKSIEDYIREY